MPSGFALGQDLWWAPLCEADTGFPGLAEWLEVTWCPIDRVAELI